MARRIASSAAGLCYVGLLPARAEYGAQFFEWRLRRAVRAAGSSSAKTARSLRVLRAHTTACATERSQTTGPRRSSSTARTFGERGDLFGDLRIAGPPVTNQRDVPDFHHVVRRDRRQHVVSRQTPASVNATRCVECVWTMPRAVAVVLVDAAMQGQRFRRPAAGHAIAVEIDLGDIGGIEPAKASVGRRDQPAVVEPRADVAGGADRVAASVETRAGYADFFANAGFVRGMEAGAPVIARLR